MKKPTKKQLKDEITKLQRDLYECISRLPDSEFSQQIKIKYPNYYSYFIVRKYGENLTPLFVDFLNSDHTNGFFHFEKR